MRVTGIVVWRVLLGAVLCFLLICQLDDWGQRGRDSERMDALARDGDMILEEVRMKDTELRRRDEVLMEGIRESKERMEELARLREMTSKEVVVMKDSIKVERMRFDSLSKTMTDW